MNLQELWQGTLGELELQISKASFNTWLKNTFIDSFENKILTIAVPNIFAKEWLEKKYHSIILKIIQSFDDSIELKEIKYIVKIRPSVLKTASLDLSAQTGKKEAKESLKPSFSNPVNGENLNQNYTFENLVVGKNNELAAAAGKAIVNNPGKAYNPLFIYGGVGLGKTHLIQAIGNEIVKKLPKKKVLYVTCEKFSEDYINFIQEGKDRNLLKFKNKYRNVDVLIIDDIQFLSGRERFQEEFFHTFNVLYQQDRQIILTSDKTPKALPKIEGRITSRFEAGMIADITFPDFDTRIAILKRKIEEKSFSLSEEIINYIAQNTQHSVRELEVALNKIIVHTQLGNPCSSLEEVKAILKPLFCSPLKKAISIKKVLKTVSEFYEIKLENLLSESRKKNIVFPRQIAMYLLKKEGNFSYTNIGEEFGGKDHTTIIYAYEKIKKELEQNERLQEEIEILKQKIFFEE